MLRSSVSESLRPTHVEHLTGDAGSGRVVRLAILAILFALSAV